MPTATRRNNSMSHFNDIEALLRKKKIRIVNRQHLYYSFRKADSLIITSNLLLFQTITVVYITAPQKYHTASGHSCITCIIGSPACSTEKQLKSWMKVLFINKHLRHRKRSNVRFLVISYIESQFKIMIFFRKWQASKL